MVDIITHLMSKKYVDENLNNYYTKAETDKAIEEATKGNEWELIESIVCDGTYGNMARTGLTLKKAKIYFYMKAATEATTLCVEAKNNEGMFGYAWIGNGINTGERWANVYLESEGETAYCEYTNPATSSYGSAGLNRTTYKQDAATPINRIGIYATNNKMFPTNSTIEIWGVRA